MILNVRGQIDPCVKKKENIDQNIFFHVLRYCCTFLITVDTYMYVMIFLSTSATFEQSDNWV